MCGPASVSNPGSGQLLLGFEFSGNVAKALYGLIKALEGFMGLIKALEGFIEALEGLVCTVHANRPTLQFRVRFSAWVSATPRHGTFCEHIRRNMQLV